MSKALQLRRGTSQQHLSFIGLDGEISINTDDHTIIVHDGLTSGGFEIINKAQVSALYAPKANSLSGYGILDAYTKTEIDIALDNKANSGTSLSSYNIVDAYTQSAVNSLLTQKADATITRNKYNMLSGIEYNTEVSRNGFEIFGMLLDGFNLPNNTTISIPIPNYEPNYKYWLVNTTYADNSSTSITLPYYHPTNGTCSIIINNGNLEITTDSNFFAAYVCNVEFNFIKLSITTISGLGVSNDLLWSSPPVDLLNDNLPTVSLL